MNCNKCEECGRFCLESDDGMYLYCESCGWDNDDLTFTENNCDPNLTDVTAAVEEAQKERYELRFSGNWGDWGRRNLCGSTNTLRRNCSCVECSWYRQTTNRF